MVQPAQSSQLIKGHPAAVKAQACLFKVAWDRLCAFWVRSGVLPYKNTQWPCPRLPWSHKYILQGVANYKFKLRGVRHVGAKNFMPCTQLWLFFKEGSIRPKRTNTWVPKRCQSRNMNSKLDFNTKTVFNLLSPLGWNALSPRGCLEIVTCSAAFGCGLAAWRFFDKISKLAWNLEIEFLKSSVL